MKLNYSVFNIILLLTFITLSVGVNCPRAKVQRTGCKKGQLIETTVYYAQNAEGECVEKTQTLYKPCSLLPGEHFCRCSVVGDPHYRTFNGQLIHYFGNCTYSLAESLDEKSNCSFKIRGKNEHRSKNLNVTYLRYMTVEMYGKKITLHQFKRVYIDGIIANLPVEVNNDVQIFLSGNMVQLVSQKCGLEVSFDGDSNGYLMISREYAGKMMGMCGDCVKGHSDFVTKDGVDVSTMEDKMNLIGNSYAVESVGHGSYGCHPPPPLPKSFCTDDQLEKLVKPKHHCGSLIDENGPFKDCLKKVNAQQLYESCEIDICANANSPEDLQKARCEIFQAMEEACAMHDVTGLTWRATLKCPLTCGPNKEYKANMNPCPKTCENHFFGTRKQCYDLPNREGCECKPGYLLDGMLCVKPDQCACLEGCRDSADKSDCKKWVSEGKCKTFPRLMQHVCRASCKFCKKEVRDICVDRISTERCEEYRHEGKCKDKFYKMACGLTCHPFTCPCKQPSLVETPCDKVHMVKKVTQTLWKRKHGQCVPDTESAILPCGRCGGKVSVKMDECDVCHGTQKRIEKWTKREGKLCMQEHRESMAICQKCDQNKKEFRRCINNDQEEVTIIWYDAIHCKECKKRVKKVRNPVICKKQEFRDTCDKEKCYVRVSKVSHKIENCQCKRLVEQHFEKCCCSKKDEVREKCENGCKVTMTKSYSFANGDCVSKIKVTRDCKELPKPVKTLGACDANTKHAIDTLKNFYFVGCEIKSVETHEARVCKCEEPYEHTTCAKSVNEIVTTKNGYTLIKNKEGIDVCNKMTLSINRKQVICPTELKKELGTCDLETCQADQTITLFHAIDCKCQPEERIVKVDCCCKNEKSEPKCVDNKLVTKTITRKLVANTCEKEHVVLEIENPKCPEPKVEQGECNKETGNYVETHTYFKVVDCICQKNVETKLIPCNEKCPTPSVKLGKCDNSTCTQDKEVITHKFNGFKCSKEVQSFKQPCCEPFEKKEEMCDKKTGKLIEKKTKKILAKDVGEPVLDEKITFIHKPDECKQTTSKSLGCGAERPNKEKIIHYVSVPDPKTCRCEQKKSMVEWKVCKCPESKELPKACYNDKYIESKTISYQLTNGTCERTVKVDRQIVNCPDPVIHTTPCQNCKATTQRIFYKSEGCKCVKKVEVLGNNIDCCCQPPKSEKKCLKKKYCAKITHVEERQGTKCIRKVYMNVRKAFCDKKVKIQHTKCESCVQDEIVSHYGIQDCQCVKLNETKTQVNCCCPKVNHKTKCINGKKVNIEKTHRLIKGKCYPKVKTSVVGTQCPIDSYIRGQCDWKTMTQTLRRIYFVHDESSCRCIQKEIRTKIQCQCDLPMTIRKDTNDTMKGVVVLRVFTNSSDFQGDLSPEKLGLRKPSNGTLTTKAPIDINKITLKMGSAAARVGLSTTPGPGSLPTSQTEEYGIVYLQNKIFTGKLNPQQRIALNITEPDELPLLLTQNERKILNLTDDAEPDNLTKKQLILIGKKSVDDIPRKLTEIQRLVLEELKKTSEIYGKLTKEQKDALELSSDEELPFKLTEEQKKKLGIEPSNEVTKLTKDQLKKLNVTDENKIPRKVTERQQDILDDLENHTFKKPKTIRLTQEIRDKLGLTSEEKLPILLTPDQKTKLAFKLSDENPKELTDYQKNVLNLGPKDQLPLQLTPIQREKLGMEPEDKLLPLEELPTKKGTTGFTVLTTLAPDEAEILRQRLAELKRKEMIEEARSKNYTTRPTIASLNLTVFSTIPAELAELRKHCNHQHDEPIHDEDKECTKEIVTKKQCKPDGKTLEIVEIAQVLREITIDGILVKKCLPKVEKKLIPAEEDSSCTVLPRKHWTGCNENKRCLIEIFAKVENCTCSKASKVLECIGCKCAELASKEKKCEGNFNSIITKQYRSSQEKCAVFETVQKTPVECAKPVKLIGICEIKKDNAVLREVLEPKSAIANCKCVEKPEKSLEFCHCKDSKFFFECDKKSNNRIHTEVTYVRSGLKCEPVVNKTVENPECPPRKFIEEGKCHLSTCMRPIILRESIIEDCQCKLKKTKRHVPCCCNKNTVAVAGIKPEFKERKFCHKDSIVTMSQKIELRTREDRVFPLPDSPKETYCSKETIVSSSKVTCPSPKVVHECDEKLNLWTYKEIKYFDINCKCKTKVNTTHVSGCAEPAKPGVVCPKSNTTFTECKNGVHEKVDTIYVLIKGECKKFEKRFPLKCECARESVKDTCVDGKHIVEVTTETLSKDMVCQKKVEKKIASMGCTKAETNDYRVFSRSDCDEKGKMKVEYVKNIWDRSTCKCVVKKKTEEVDCRCKPCEIVSKKCAGDVKQAVTYKCEKLIGGKCEPYFKIESEPVVCASKGEEKLKGECNAATGIRNVTVSEVKAVDCVCKKVEKQVKEYCDCSKDPKYAPKHQLTCSNDDKLDMIHTQYEPNGTVCKPEVYEKSTKVSCDLEPKVSVSNCENCKREIVLYNMTPKNCTCTKNILEKKSITCCCPAEKKIVKEVCKANIIYQEIEQQELIAGKCEPKINVVKKEVECNQPPEMKRKCVDCNGHEELYEHKVVDCKCIPVLVKTHPIDCCCKKEASLKHYCDTNTGAKVTEVSVMKLIEDKCQLVTKRIEKMPKECAEGKKCYNELSPQCVRDSKYLFRVCHEPVKENCSCKKTIKKLATVSCSCLPEERIYKTPCVNETRQIKVYTKAMIDGSCKEKLLESINAPCSCKDTITEKCINEKFMEKTYIYSKFNEKETKCITHSKVDRYPIAECNPHPKKLEPEVMPCDGKQQMIFIKKLIVKDCDCRIDKIPKTVPCSCEKNLVTNTTCNGNTTVVTTTKFNELENGKCIEKVSEHQIKLTGCNAKKTSTGPCIPETNNTGRSVRDVFEEEFKHENCKCITTKKKVGQEYCACKGNHAEEVCHDKKLIHKSISEKLVNGKCIKVETKDEKDMAKECAKQNGVTVGEVSPKTGQILKTTTKSVVNNNCGCNKEELHEICDEKCPKIDSKQECSGDYLIKNTIVTGNSDGCRCHKNETVIHTEPKCPENKDPITITPCVKIGKLGFQEQIIRSIVKDHLNCTCSIKEEKKTLLCSIEPEPTKTTTCRSDVVQSESTKEKIVNQRTLKNETVTTAKQDREIKCAQPKYVNKCAKDKGPGSIEIIKFEPKNCTCERVTEVQDVDCACNPIRKLIGYGTCDKMTCNVKVKYASKTRDVEGKCVVFTETEKEKCCCPAPKKTTKCNAEKGLIIEYEETYQLKHGQCSLTVDMKQKPVKCTPTVTESHKCDNITGVATKTSFVTALRGCECKNYPIEIEVGKCKCEEPEVIKTCDAPNRRFEIVKIEEENKDLKCVKKITKTHEPIKCEEKKSIIEGDCDKTTGEKEIITTETFIDGACKCQTITKKTKQICTCGPPPPDKQICNPNTGVITYFKYEVTRNNGQCGVKEVKENKQTSCVPAIWTPVPSDSCMHRVFEKAVRKGCHCEIKTKTEPCDCNCNVPETSFKCAPNGHFIIKRVYKAHKQNCKCIITFNDVQEPVYCPNKVEKYGKCDTQTCIQHKNIENYVVDNCKCVKKIVSKPQACCCKNNGIKVKCIKAFGVKSVVQSIPQLADGTCHSHERKVEMKINCDKLNAELGGCSPTGKCDTKNGTQTYTCLRYTREGCECKPQQVQVTKLCTCKPEKRDEGACDPKTCKKTITLRQYFESNGQCVEAVKTKDYECCCKDVPDKTEECVANKKILTVSYYNYDKEKGTCIRHSTVKDVTPKCKASYSKAGKCEQCVQPIYTTVQERINCKCQSRTYISKKISCCCSDKVALTEKCLGKVFHVTQKSEVLKNDKCRPISLETTSRVICPEDEIRSYQCDYKTCQQVLRIVRHKVEECKCKATIQLYHVKCCVTDNGFEIEKCDALAGKVEKTKVLLEVNPKGGLIDKKDVSEVIVTKCPENKMEISGKCDIFENDKRYQITKITEYIRVACQCSKIEKHVKKVCGCNKPREKEVCSPGGIKKHIRISYHVVLLPDGEKICKEFTKTLRQSQTVCSKDVKKEEFDCDDETQKKKIVLTEYVRQGCKCVQKKREYLVTCACPKQEKEEKCLESFKEIAIKDYTLQCTKDVIPKCQCETHIKTAREKVDCPKFENSESPCMANGFKQIYVATFSIKNCECIKTKKPTQRVPCHVCDDSLDLAQCEKMVKDGQCNKLHVSKACKKSCGFCLRDTCKAKPNARIFYKTILHARLGADEVKNGKLNLIKEIPLVSNKHCIAECDKINACVSGDIIEESKKCRLYNVDHAQLQKTEKRNYLRYIKSGSHFHMICDFKCPSPKVNKVGECKCESTTAGKLCTQEVQEQVFIKKDNCTATNSTKTVSCGCVNLKSENVCSKYMAEGKCSDKQISEVCAKTCKEECQECGRDIKLNLCKMSDITKNVTYHTVREMAKKDGNSCVVSKTVTDTLKSCEANKCPDKETQVENCDKGVRKIITSTYVPDISVGCKLITDVTTSKCESCCPAVEYEISDCINDERVMTMTYWENKNNCCVKQVKTTRFACNDKCDVDKIDQSACIYGQRIHYHTFYYGPVCTEKTISKIVAC